MKVVIMAGGKGTRISSISSEIPKPMIPISGIPVLEHEICSLRNQGFCDFIITIGHLGHVIKNYFGDGSKFGVKIEYFVEKTPLGNAGALFYIKDELVDDFLLINGDAIFEIDFLKFLKYHKEKGGLVTIFTHPNSHPFDSSLIVTDTNNCVTNWLSKGDNREGWYKNRVNAGIHIISPKILNNMKVEQIVDLDKDILKPLAGTEKMFAYNSSEYVKDMGTPERYFAVINDFQNNIVQNKCYLNKQKAIFLDRDGTINKLKGFLKDINEFELLENVAEAIKEINSSCYLAIVVTNQPVIARGEISFNELEKIHNKMETLLAQKGAYLDAIYYCPHHPHKGFKGEREDLKINCNCRKPKPGMLLKAAADFNIDLSQSFLIGDGENDIGAAIAAGCKPILLSGKKRPKINTKKNLMEAIKSILK